MRMLANKHATIDSLRMRVRFSVRQVAARCFAFGLAVFPVASGAALVSLDFRTPGDSALTLDTDSKLEWLDVSYTAGIGYQSVASGWSGLTTVEGFRFPEASEIEDLLVRFGIQRSSDALAENYAPALSFQSLLGVTGIGGSYAATRGFFALGSIFYTPNGTPRYSLVSYHVVSSDSGVAWATGVGVRCLFSDCYSVGAADYGSFLVRTARDFSEIEEPHTLALLSVASFAALFSRVRAGTRRKGARNSSIR